MKISSIFVAFLENTTLLAYICDFKKNLPDRVQLRQLMYTECITLQIIKFARDTKKSSKVALKALKNATIISDCLVLLQGGCGIVGFDNKWVKYKVAGTLKLLQSDKL